MFGIQLRRTTWSSLIAAPRSQERRSNQVASEFLRLSYTRRCYLCFASSAASGPYAGSQ